MSSPAITKVFYSVSVALLCLTYRASVPLAQPITVSLAHRDRALLQVDSSNWNEAWIEVSGMDTSTPMLTSRDLSVSNGQRVAEILSVDSIGAQYRSRLALSFVLDNSASMFHSFDTLTRLCDSILGDLPPGITGQSLTFDNAYRNPSYLYTAHASTFLAQSFANEFTEDRAVLRKFWHFFDTIRTQFTPLYDAIAAAITNIDDRRGHDTLTRSDVLIVVTDGEDNASRISIKLLENLLVSAHIRLFAINYRVEEEGRLPWLARQTGGAYFLAEKLPQLTSTLLAIGRSLTRQYHVRYRFPSLGPSTGKQ